MIIRIVRCDNICQVNQSLYSKQLFTIQFLYLFINDQNTFIQSKIECFKSNRTRLLVRN